MRVRAADTQEIVWETVITGRRVESLPILQEAIAGMESRLGLQGNEADTLKKRGRTEIRLDSGWGSGPNITWLLQRGYQVTGKGIVNLIKFVDELSPLTSHLHVETGDIERRRWAGTPLLRAFPLY